MYQQAADDIYTASTLWRSALLGLRHARLIGKESVRSAETIEDATPHSELAIGTIKQILAQVE